MVTADDKLGMNISSTLAALHSVCLSSRENHILHRPNDRAVTFNAAMRLHWYF